VGTNKKGPAEGRKEDDGDLSYISKYLPTRLKSPNGPNDERRKQADRRERNFQAVHYPYGSQEHRFTDIRAALGHVITVAPPESREMVRKATQKAFEGVLLGFTARRSVKTRGWLAIASHDAP
jgi:hypothetical protein